MPLNLFLTNPNIGRSGNWYWDKKVGSFKLSLILTSVTSISQMKSRANHQQVMRNSWLKVILRDPRDKYECQTKTERSCFLFLFLYCTTLTSNSWLMFWFWEFRGSILFQTFGRGKFWAFKSWAKWSWSVKFKRWHEIMSMSFYMIFKFK